MRSGSVHDDGPPTGIRLYFMAIPSALRCPVCGGRAMTGGRKAFLWLCAAECAECGAPLRGRRGLAFVVLAAFYSGSVIVHAYGADLTWQGWMALTLAFAGLLVWLRYGVRLHRAQPDPVRATPPAAANRLRRIQRVSDTVIAVLLITIVPTAIFVASFLVPPDTEPAWIPAALRVAAASIFAWTMVRISVAEPDRS